jgi:hypothetical protein
MNSPIDSRPSTSRHRIREVAGDLRWYLEVRGLGVVTILVSSDWNDPKGKPKLEKLGILTLSSLGETEPPSL